MVHKLQLMRSEPGTDFEGKVGMLYVKDDQKRDKNDFNTAGTACLFPPQSPGSSWKKEKFNSSGKTGMILLLPQHYQKVLS